MAGAMLVVETQHTGDKRLQRHTLSSSELQPLVLTRKCTTPTKNTVPKLLG